jgi:hypothetical protein
VGKLREFFQLYPDVELISPEATELGVCPEASEQLVQFNIEWHVIPSADAVPLNDAYMARFYPLAAPDFTIPHEHKPSYREAITAGHRKHQGRIIGVETTVKPRYLPSNRQFYGTPYGFKASADPFCMYLAQAGMTNATRYAHNYLSLRTFVNVVNDDWRERGVLPSGYRLTVCPPAIFNFVGNIFHPEWSATQTLELGFYRDDQNNATCFAVGCNAPNDFSYISEIEFETDWTLAGFRTALVPE